MTRFKPPQRAKRDANEGDLFKILRGWGLTVEATDQPVDAIVGYKGVNYLVEIKNGPKARISDAQKKFFAKWPGQYVILCTEDEAHAFAQSVRYPQEKASRSVPIRGSITG